MIVVPRPLWAIGAKLGEGPVWLPDEGRLWFVDIKSGFLHSYDPSTGSGNTLSIGGQPSFVVPVESGGLLVGSNHGLHLVEDNKLGTPVATITQPTGNRTNDATVDAAGRLWFGTMDDAEERRTGAVWCLDRGKLRCAGAEAVVTNGPAVTRDCRHLYHVDSGERSIWRYPIGGTGRLENGELFVRLEETEGFPDGIVLDSEDCLWVALWDGWGLRRYAPDGTLLLHVKLPCARVTKLAFGGPDLQTAFVTTAKVGLDEAAQARQPLAGSLFAFRAPAPGCAANAVRLR